MFGIHIQSNAMHMIMRHIQSLPYKSGDILKSLLNTIFISSKTQKPQPEGWGFTRC